MKRCCPFLSSRDDLSIKRLRSTLCIRSMRPDSARRHTKLVCRWMHQPFSPTNENDIAVRVCLIVCISALLLKQKAQGNRSGISCPCSVRLLRAARRPGQPSILGSTRVLVARRHGRRLVIGAQPTCTRPPYWDSWLRSFQKLEAPCNVPDSSSKQARH